MYLIPVSVSIQSFPTVGLTGGVALNVILPPPPPLDTVDQYVAEPLDVSTCPDVP